MKATIEYTVGQTEATIRTADGGVATVYHNGDHMVSEYYQSRCSEREPNWELLAEGKMYIHDWEGKQSVDSEIIIDALHWLVMPQPEFDISEHYLFKAPALGLKTCTSCEEEKLRDEFYAELRNKDGLNSNCKICRNRIVNKYAAKLKAKKDGNKQ